ncbi:MAG: ROK family protein [Planctomycetaceae bacterium]
MNAPRKNQRWIGFDLGGTKMLAAVFDDGLKQLARKRKKTRAHEGVEGGLDRMKSLIRDVLDEAKLTIDDVSGIGVGVPGPLDLNVGVVREAPNLGWVDVRLADLLQKEYGCPVVIANDVDLGVYGEFRCGAAKGSRCVVGVFPGTGIGGGCVYEGKILRGKTMSCMEIGHIPVIPDGPLCGCGLRGCLEAVASRLAVSALAAAAAFRGQAPYLQKKTKTTLSEIRSSTLATAIKNGDAAVEGILKTAADYIGRGVATIVHLIAPDVIILGGGLVEAMPELIRKEVEKNARRHILSSMQDTFKVVLAELDDDAATTGAAAWVQRTLAEPPATAQFEST